VRWAIDYSLSLASSLQQPAWVWTRPVSCWRHTSFTTERLAYSDCCSGVTSDISRIFEISTTRSRGIVHL